jgi:hypothetical protein
MKEIERLKHLRKLLREKEVPVEPVPVPEAPPLTLPSKGGRPERLKGMTLGEILTLECDGDLSEDEKKWLSGKSFDR